MQDTYHGQPHGIWAADECFGGLDLNRGIELCAVVEQMYSLQHMFHVQHTRFSHASLRRGVANLGSSRG
jgi:hypothetical protein